MTLEKIGEQLGITKERVRQLNRHATAWTPDERAQAESELEAIMQRVRGEAVHARESR